jgi:hypothetical protein
LRKLQFRAQQIFYIVDWAGTHLRIDPKIGSLERAVSRSRHAIPFALADGLNQPKPPGRHFAVRGESETKISAWITGKAEKNVPVSGRTKVLTPSLMSLNIQPFLKLWFLVWIVLSIVSSDPR